MKIGLIGWYGHNNYGDERMLFCIRRYFSRHDVFVTSAWNEARDNLSKLNKCNYVLVGGGGFTLNSSGRAKEIILGLTVPFAAIGISIEAMHSEMREFIDILTQRAEFILVRDRRSKMLMGNHYKVIVGPDLTFLYPFKIVDVVEDNICGLSLMHWFWWRNDNWGCYHNIMKFLNKHIPIFERIYLGKKWNPQISVRIIRSKFSEVYPIPFYFEEGANNDIRLLKRYFQNVPERFDISTYGKIRYLVGMRYHSIVFATQCGIPFISLSYEPKNDEFCSELGLDVLSLDIYKKMDELESKVDYIQDHYHKIRARLIEYREKSIREIRYIFKSISRLILGGKE